MRRGTGIDASVGTAGALSCAACEPRVMAPRPTLSAVVRSDARARAAILSAANSASVDETWRVTWGQCRREDWDLSFGGGKDGLATHAGGL